MTTKKHKGILLALLLLAMIAGYAAISIGHAKAPVITIFPALPAVILMVLFILFSSNDSTSDKARARGLFVSAIVRYRKRTSSVPSISPENTAFPQK